MCRLFLFGAICAFPSSNAAAAAPKTDKQGVGVLLLAHGGSRQWNKEVLKIQKELGRQWPVETAFGMADVRETKKALEKLQKRPIQQLVIVPLFVSSYSEVMDQIRYMLGLREKPSEELLKAPHAHHSRATLERVRPKIPFVLTGALDDHPLVAEILLERAKALSRKPQEENVVLVGHGPVLEEYDQKWLEVMSRLGLEVQKKGGFRFVHAATLRDDAPREIRDKAEKKLQNLVRQLSRQGRTLVIPHLISQGGIEKKIQKALEGAFYSWDGKTLLPHSNIAEWAAEAVERSAGEVSDAGRSRPAGLKSAQESY